MTTCHRRFGDRASTDTAAVRVRGKTRFLSWIVLPVILAGTLTLSSCLPAPVPTRTSRGELAEIYVYLQPLPEETRRLVWSVGDLAAVRADSSRVPLDLKYREITGRDLTDSQVLIANGFVPPGFYDGISVKIDKAVVMRVEGDASLLVPDKPVDAAGSFELRPSQVLSLFLSLDSAGSVPGGFQFSPTFSLALPSRELDSLTGYLVMPRSDRVTVFNRKTLQVTGSVATGRSPWGIAVNATRGRAYIALSEDDAIQVLDITNGRITEQISLRTGDEPKDLVLTEDGDLLLSANYGSDTVSIIDPLQGIEKERIRVGQGPTSVTVNRSGTRAYVTSSLAHTLSVIDLTVENLGTALSMEEATPLAAALDKNERNLFVISRDSTNLTIVDPDTLEVKEKIYIGTGAVSVAIDPLSDLVLVGRQETGEILMVDPFALMVVDTIGLEGSAGQMTVDHQENALMVLIPERKLLKKIDLVGKKILAEMELDTIPSEVAVIEDR